MVNYCPGIEIFVHRYFCARAWKTSVQALRFLCTSRGVEPLRCRWMIGDAKGMKKIERRKENYKDHGKCNSNPTNLDSTIYNGW